MCFWFSTEIKSDRLFIIALYVLSVSIIEFCLSFFGMILAEFLSTGSFVMNINNEHYLYTSYGIFPVLEKV